MKLLHTSDWHLGHTLYGYDRTVEQENMLLQIQEKILDLQPDVLVMSGDLFHTSMPGAGVQRMMVNALADFHAAAPDMIIIVLAGNHDSAAKIDIFRRPWLMSNVFTVSYINPERLDDLIIEIPGKGYVISVPYCHSRLMPDCIYSTLVSMAAERNTQGLPVVMAAHTTVSDCDFSSHDKSSSGAIGGIDGIDVAEFGSGYDYVALGHIHFPQWVGDTRRVRYSGTPLAVSFDEQWPHSVSLVTIASHGDLPQVEELPIEPLIPLVTLPASGFGDWNDLVHEVESIPADKPMYLRLNVESNGNLPPDARAQARRLMEEKKGNFCLINRHFADVAASDGEQGLSVDELRKMEPIMIAREVGGKDFTPEMEQMFNEIMSMINEEERNR